MRLRRWMAVLTLLCLAVVLSGCGDDADTATLPTSTDSSEDTERGPNEPADAVIDECLLGVWSTVSYQSEATVDGRQVLIVDLQRLLTFTSDGTETVEYLDSPAEVRDQTGQVVGEATYSGEFTYRVDTDTAGAISFELVDGEVAGTFTIDGTQTQFEVNGESAPVDYTCDDGEHTQSSPGYEATYTRAT